MNEIPDEAHISRFLIMNGLPQNPKIANDQCPPFPNRWSDNGDVEV